MMPNLKIAVFHNLPFGGGKTTVFELTKILSKKHIIDLYKFLITEEDYFNLKQLVRTIYKFEYKKLFLKRPFGFLNVFLVFLNLYRLDRLYCKIATAINKGGYDVAFIHASFYDYVHAPGLLKYLTLPTVYYCQEPTRRFYEPNIAPKRYLSSKIKVYNFFFSPINKLYKCYFKIYDRYNIRCINSVLCNSYYTEEYIYRVYGILAKVNYLGVDVQKFRPLDIPKEHLVVSIGYLEHRKGHDFVIKAIARLLPQFRPKLGIAFYHDFSEEEKIYKNYLEQLAKNNGVDIVFYGGLFGERLCSLYNKAKLTTCAYIMEPFGLVPLESMACGTPVIGVKEGGLCESIIHNETGILTERNIDEFSRAIQYLLENVDIRIKMSKAGRKCVIENWTWEKSAQEVEKNLLSVIKNG